MSRITPTRPHRGGLRRYFGSALALAAAAALAAPLPVAADPPSWAPAHGYRAKHGRHSEYDRDGDHFLPRPVIAFDGDRGTCNRDVIGMVLGGAAGGLAGSQIGKGDGRTVAIIAGAVLGAMLGDSIGSSMDRIDRHCLGTALDRAPAHNTIIWRDDDTHRSYAVQPQNSYIGDDGRLCREYTMQVTVGGTPQTVHGRACRKPDGDWQIMS